MNKYTLLLLIFIVQISSLFGQFDKYKRTNLKPWCNCDLRLNENNSDYEYDLIYDTDKPVSGLFEKGKSFFVKNNFKIISEIEGEKIQGLIQKKVAIGRALSPTYIGVQYQLNLLFKDGKYRIVVDNFNITNSSDQITSKVIDYLKIKGIGGKNKKKIRSQLVFQVEGFIELGNNEKKGIIEELNTHLTSTDKYSEW